MKPPRSGTSCKSLLEAHHDRCHQTILIGSRLVTPLDAAVLQTQVELNAFQIPAEAESQHVGARLRHVVLVVHSKSETGGPGVTTVVELDSHAPHGECAGRDVEPFPLLLGPHPDGRET